MLGIHVARGTERTRRFELAKTQILIGSSDQNDLMLTEGGIQRLHCVLTLEDGAWWLSPAPARQPHLALNGEIVTARRAIADGDRIAVGVYDVVIDGMSVGAPVDPVERALIAAITEGDDACRLVYADWLEQRGDDVRAEFLRVQQIAFADGTNAKDPQVQRSIGRLRDLADRTDIVWRQRIARVAIVGCAREGTCPGDWSRLVATDNPRLRRCETCRSDVHYCRSSREVEAHDLGRRVAIDIGDRTA
jgi:uncharacterized protein (TIGR02996 family)